MLAIEAGCFSCYYRICQILFDDNIQGWWNFPGDKRQEDGTCLMTKTSRFWFWRSVKELTTPVKARDQRKKMIDNNRASAMKSPVKVY